MSAKATIFRFLAFILFYVQTFAVAAGTPTVFWHSSPVEPGQTLAITGVDFGAQPRVLVRRLSDDPESMSFGAMRSILPMRASDTHVYVALPNVEPGVFDLEIATQDGSWRGAINAPEVYWTQGDLGVSAASQGGWLRLVGRNVTRGDGARLDLLAGDGQRVVRLGPRASGLWDASFEIPANIPAGSYKFALWSGQGDMTTLARGIVEIRAKRPAGRVVNVLAFGAKGDGRSDDGLALGRAIANIVATGGGTVLLPAGTYLLSRAVLIPPHVSLRGADRDLSVIVLKDQAQPPDIFIRGTRDFSIENLTILALNHWHIIEGGFTQTESGATASNIRIDSVTIRASFYRRYIKPDEVHARYLKSISTPGNGPDAIRLHGSNLSVTNSDIQTSVRSLFVVEGKGLIVKGNRFLNGRRGWYTVSNSQEVLFVDNDIIGADLQASGGGINTLARVENRLLTRNVLFKGNRSRFHNGADGEAMTTDSPGGCYYGPINIEANSNVVTLGAPDQLVPACFGGGLMISDGRGAGQYAAIVAVEADRITLDRALPIGSDAATTAVIVPMQENIIMAENTAEDVGLALQSFGAAANTIIVDNRSFRTGGFSLWSGRYGTKIPQLNLYSQFLRNELKGGYLSSLTQYESAFGLIKIYAHNLQPDSFPLVRDVVIRSNRLLGNAGIYVASSRPAPAGISDVLLEGNTITATRTGINVLPGTRELLLLKNDFENVRIPTVDRSH